MEQGGNDPIVVKYDQTDTMIEEEHRIGKIDSRRLEHYMYRLTHALSY